MTSLILGWEENTVSCIILIEHCCLHANHSQLHQKDSAGTTQLQSVTVHCSSLVVDFPYCFNHPIFVARTLVLCYTTLHQTYLYQIKSVCLATGLFTKSMHFSRKSLWPQLLQQSSSENVQHYMFLSVQCLKCKCIWKEIVLISTPRTGYSLRAAEILTELEYLSYEKTLRELGLFGLEKRCLQGDLTTALPYLEKAYNHEWEWQSNSDSTGEMNLNRRDLG